MKIEAYAAVDADIPEARRAVAYIRHDGETLPVRFTGSSVEDARSKAQAHWDEKVEAQRSAKPRGRPRKTDDVGDVI